MSMECHAFGMHSRKNLIVFLCLIFAINLAPAHVPFANWPGIVNGRIINVRSASHSFGLIEKKQRERIYQWNECKWYFWKMQKLCSEIIKYLDKSLASNFSIYLYLCKILDQKIVGIGSRNYLTDEDSLIHKFYLFLTIFRNNQDLL